MIANPKAAAASRTKQQFNVYLPPELVRRAKYRALDDQMSLSDLVEKALVTYLEKEGRNA
jgi:predicted HicB family RNase H-like nuclease